MINMVVLTGRLVKDPELKVTPSGKYVTSFTIANDVGYGDNKKTNFVPIVAWEKTAEFVTKNFMKGSAIGIVGKLQVRQYEDKDGNKRTTTEIVTNDVQFVESKKSNAGNNEVASQQFDDIDGFMPVQDDGDLPF